MKSTAVAVPVLAAKRGIEISLEIDFEDKLSKMDERDRTEIKSPYQGPVPEGWQHGLTAERCIKYNTEHRHGGSLTLPFITKKNSSSPKSKGFKVP
jgi:hypothetical protein